jgi:hypothetical protein
LNEDENGDGDQDKLPEGTKKIDKETSTKPITKSSSSNKNRLLAGNEVATPDAASGKGTSESTSDKLKEACHQLGHELAVSDNMSTFITIVIIVVNEVLTAITFSLIPMVKFANKSQETGALTKVLFISYFFNTAVIILMVNMNMSEHSPQALWGFLQGRYTDYSAQWYNDVGYQIYQTYFV